MFRGIKIRYCGKLYVFANWHFHWVVIHGVQIKSLAWFDDNFEKWIEYFINKRMRLLPQWIQKICLKENFNMVSIQKALLREIETDAFCVYYRDDNLELK